MLGLKKLSGSLFRNRNHDAINVSMSKLAYGWLEITASTFLSSTIMRKYPPVQYTLTVITIRKPM
jgi:hypothetical protein